MKKMSRLVLGGVSLALGLLSVSVQAQQGSVQRSATGVQGTDQKTGEQVDGACSGVSDRGLKSLVGVGTTSAVKGAPGSKAGEAK
jgi:hypothetical protein